jgi:CRP/FNR family transcriptional regulator, cyclic AMP receptor protein
MALAFETILERNQLFRGLPVPTLRSLAAIAIRRHVSPKSEVFFRGDAGGALYGIVTGRVRISNSLPGGREVFLNLIEPGECFGEIALLDGNPRTATATALVKTELMVIQQETFRELLQKEPLLAVHLIKLLCQRVRWSSGLAEDLALLYAPARIARRLLCLAHAHGRRIQTGVQMVISQEELAQFLGLSRQAVNQQLREWVVTHWIALGRGRITIINEAALRAVVGEQMGAEATLD